MHSYEFTLEKGEESVRHVVRRPPHTQQEIEFFIHVL